MTTAAPTIRRLGALSFALLMVLGAAGCANLPSGAVAPADIPVAAVTPAAVPASGPATMPAAVAPPAVVAATAPATAAPDPIAGPLPRVHDHLDTEVDADRTDLWARLRSGFAVPDLDNDLVHKWEQWYAARPEYVQRMTERGGRYLFHIVEEVQHRGMPLDLALLPFIESAYNPQAVSSTRASGMWQFMPTTAKDFELKQNLFRDDRRDVLASTRAALDYLQQLHDQFDDWQLALAAYNWGPGNVQRAIARNQKAGLPTDYASLKMPEETRNYVPKLQAVKNIILRPEAFSLSLPPLENHPFFLSVAIDRDIDVALAAKLADLPLEEFQQLNPQMNRPVILAAGTPQVLLPYDNANRFLRQLEIHRGPMASWTAWVAPKTLSPADAARRVGMSEGQLREVNRIPARMLVKVGSTLLVPRSAHVTTDVDEHIADNAVMVLAPETPPLRKIAFRVGKKPLSVAWVAHRYRVSPAQVAQWNNGIGAKASFRPGQTVVVMQPVATRVAAKRHAPPRHGSKMARAPQAAHERLAER